jgi:hypothetical protein
MAWLPGGAPHSQDDTMTEINFNRRALRPAGCHLDASIMIAKSAGGQYSAPCETPAQ